MCGICGVVRFDGQSVPGGIDDALRLLHHRGPDSTSSWSGQSGRTTVHFGATRLAVLDPRCDANQPLHRSGRFHLVYNGEVYNFRELRAELTAAGDRFQTESDTEVVAAACARWGADALRRLDGMWAMAFYDSKENTGFLARDPLGIKPLMYAVAGSELVFASELKALTRLGAWRKEPDAGAIVQHLVFGYIAAPATMYRAAWRLPPGHCIPFGPSGIGEPGRYCNPPGNGTGEQSDYSGSRSRIRRLIGDAVVRQKVSDVPLGAFLSGGLDSSIVVAHLAECTPHAVHTFCVGYAESETYDERHFARIVARHFGTQHEEVLLTQEDVLRSIPAVLDHLGEPVGDSSIVPTSLVSHAARQFVTVALSGDGGDELFGGYWRYMAQDALQSYNRIPGALRRGLIEPLLSALAVSRSSGPGNRARQFRKMLRARSADPLERHIAWSRILSDDAASLFVDPSLIDRALQSLLSRATAVVEARIPGGGRRDPINEILRFDVAHQLPSDMLHKVDLASMMHSLEVRVPLLDAAVVEAAASMPSSYKMYRGIRKRILVDAYRGILPDEILDRPKMGFEVPVGELLRGPLRSLYNDTVRKETIESFGILSHTAVTSIYSDHCARRADHADLLWALLSLCWWSRRQ